MSGTYTVGVSGSLTGAPAPVRTYSINIHFVCDPHRADELTRAALAVIDSMQRAPATPAEVQIVREQQLHRLELASKSDAVLVSTIDAINREGWSFELLRSDDAVRNWTAADVQVTAKYYFNLHRYARFDLVPSSNVARAE
jgi:hypothetical protein